MWDLFISVQRVIHILCVSVQGVIIVFAGIFVQGLSTTVYIWYLPSNFLSLSRSSLNLYDFCPGGHNDLLFLSRGSQRFTISVQGVTMSYYFCPGGHNELPFLSRGSQQFTISVQGVTMSYYFCPGGHSVVFFLCLGGHCGPLCLSRGKSSILPSVLVERSSK